MVIPITSDRGLCGGVNSTIAKQVRLSLSPSLPLSLSLPLPLPLPLSLPLPLPLSLLRARDNFFRGLIIVQSVGGVLFGVGDSSFSSAPLLPPSCLPLYLSF